MKGRRRNERTHATGVEDEEVESTGRVTLLYWVTVAVAVRRTDMVWRN